MRNEMFDHVVECVIADWQWCGDDGWVFGTPWMCDVHEDLVAMFGVDLSWDELSQLIDSAIESVDWADVEANLTDEMRAVHDALLEEDE